MSNKSAHVHSIKTPIVASSSLDMACGITLAFCLITGTILNILAFIYFTKIPRKKSLAERLYTVVSAVDFCTCVFQTPVMVSMVSGKRDALLFDNQAFCAVWVITFEFLQRFSIYLVMLLSVTRTIAITFPFYRIRKKAVLLSLIPYTAVMATSSIVGITCYNITFVYLTDYSYALKIILTNPYTSAEKMYNQIDNHMYNVQIFGPSLIIFISFVITLFKMRDTARCGSRTSTEKIHQASVTVALFTLIFLTLNLPFFMVLTVFTVDDQVYEYPGPIFSKWFMHWHAFPISKIVFVALNAALNPVLYCFRMAKFSNWLRQIVTWTKPEIEVTEQAVSHFLVKIPYPAARSRPETPVLQTGEGKEEVVVRSSNNIVVEEESGEATLYINSNNTESDD